MTSQKAVLSRVFSGLSPDRLKAYLKGVQGEVKKIHWTSRADLVRFTRLVLVSTVLFGFLVYLADICVRFGLDMLKAVFRMIG